MARPTLHRTRLRTRRIVYRLTDTEFLRLSHRAAQLDMRVNEFARMLALEEDKAASPGTNNRHDPALIRQIYHIGVNLNQLVKNAHIFGRVSPNVEKLCQRIEALMDEAIGKEDT